MSRQATTPRSDNCIHLTLLLVLLRATALVLLTDTSFGNFASATARSLFGNFACAARAAPALPSSAGVRQGSFGNFQCAEPRAAQREPSSFCNFDPARRADLAARPAGPPMLPSGRAQFVRYFSVALGGVAFDSVLPIDTS